MFMADLIKLHQPQQVTAQFTRALASAVFCFPFRLLQQQGTVNAAVTVQHNKVLHTQKLGAMRVGSIFFPLTDEPCQADLSWKKQALVRCLVRQLICTFNLLVSGNTFNPSQLRLGLNLSDGPRALTITICFRVATYQPFTVLHYFMAYQFLF